MSNDLKAFCDQLRHFIYDAPDEYSPWFKANMDALLHHNANWTKCPNCRLAPKKIQSGTRYNLTITMDPKLDKSQFRQAVQRKLATTLFTHGYYVFEHQDTNYHCHASVWTSRDLYNRDFNRFSDKWCPGHRITLNTRQCSRVTHDNGIWTYYAKENPPIKFKNVSTDVTYGSIPNEVHHDPQGSPPPQDREASPPSTP